MSEKNVRPNFRPLADLRKSFLPLTLGFLLLRPFQAEPADAVQPVFQALQSKISSLKTLEADVTIKASFTKPDKKVEAFHSTGKLYTEVPNHFRVNLSARLYDPDRRFPVKFTTEVVLDGKTLWLNVMNSRGKSSFLSFFDYSKLKDEFPDAFLTHDAEGYFNPADELSELNPDKIKLIGRTSFDGKPAVILEGTLKRALPVSFFNFGAGRPVTPAKVRIWVGTRDGVSYQVLTLNAAGKESGLLRLSNLRINEKVRPGTFEFSPPEGSSPIDMTPELEDELRRKARAKKP